MNRIAFALVTLLLLANLAHAQEKKKVKLADDDYANYWKLRLAQRVAAKRMQLASLGAQREAIEKARLKAFADANWTEARFKDTDSVVRNVARLVDQLKKGGDDADDAKLALTEYDKTTIATVKAHLAELMDDTAELKKADEIAREQAAQDSPSEPARDPVPSSGGAAGDGKGIAKGAPKRPDTGGLDPKWLEGTWVQDVDDTVERMAKGVPDEARADFKERMLGAFRMQALPKLVIGPGGAYEAKVDGAGGKSSSLKGTWRLEGDKLKVQYDPTLNRPDGEWELTRDGEKLLVGSGKKKGGIVYRRFEDAK